MKPLNEILKKAQKILFCPMCRQGFKLEEIKLQGSLSNYYIFQTICHNHRSPVMTVFITDYQKNINLNNDSGFDHPLEQNEVLDLYQSLEKFNGDFISLWKK
jgi:hypothetical protein